MATPLKLKEEFLTCIICHEVFRDPVTLHCGHTFCTQCVTAYTKTQKQAIAEKSIPCPHCRGLTKVPDPTRMVDDWAGQFNTGFFVKGLVEAVVTDKQDEDVCTPCQAGGETTPAVFWCCDCGDALCLGCEKVHKRLQSTKHHEVISLSKGGKSHVTKSRKRFACSKHPDAVIDMMCEDCDVAVCHRCCILHHRKCESVITMDECLPKFKSVIQTHKVELETIVKDVNKKLSAKKSRVKAVETEAEEAINVINVIREKIFAEVREQEKQLKEKVEKTKSKALQHLKKDIKSGEMKLEEAKQRQGLIEEALESDISMNYYEMYKICKPSNVSHATGTTSGTERKVMNIKLEDTSEKILSDIRDRSFAALSLSSDGVKAVGTASKPTLLKTIDTSCNRIWDVLVLTVHGLKVVIVSPWSGGSIECFYDRQGEQCKSTYNVSGPTFSLAQMSSNTCALALHDSRKIEVLKFTPDPESVRTITTTKPYIGLACLDSTSLVASTENPGSIDIIDMSGTVLRTFGSELFMRPDHMSVTKDNILVSDFAQMSVTGITTSGITKFQYPLQHDQKFLFPRGISHSRSREIFVADEKSNKIFQLTDTGKFVRCILSGDLIDPRALFVDDDNLLYVSTRTNTINVYEFT